MLPRLSLGIIPTDFFSPDFFLHLVISTFDPKSEIQDSTLKYRQQRVVMIMYYGYKLLLS